MGEPLPVCLPQKGDRIPLYAGERLLQLPLPLSPLHVGVMGPDSSSSYSNLWIKKSCILGILSRPRPYADHEITDSEPDAMTGYDWSLGGE